MGEGATIEVHERDCHAVVTLTMGERVEQWPALPHFDGLGWVYDLAGTWTSS